MAQAALVVRGVSLGFRGLAGELCPTLLIKVVVAIALLARPAHGQVASINGRMTGPAAFDTSQAFARMSSDLRALAAAQDEWFKAHDRYGKTMRRSGTGGVLVNPQPGIKLQLMYATSKGWTGRATSLAMPGKTCVIYGGDVPPSQIPPTRKQGLRPTRPRDPVCDAP